MRVLTVNGICTASRSASRMESTRSGFAQKTTAGAFLVNHRSRAAEIQIDGGDRMLLEFLRCGANDGMWLPIIWATAGLPVGCA